MIKIVLVIIVSLVILALFGSMFDLGALFSATDEILTFLSPLYDLITVLASVLEMVINSPLMFVFLFLGLVAFVRFILDLVFMKGD